MNFRRWNYNCAFYYYYKIRETISKINKNNILHLYCQTRRHWYGDASLKCHISKFKVVDNLSDLT
jgi:hypothetical protein